MPCNPKKDFSSLVAKTKVQLLCGGHFFAVYLWEDKTSLNEQAQVGEGEADACCCHMPQCGRLERKWWTWLAVHVLPRWLQDRLLNFEWVTPPKAGELHFVLDRWAMETVTHECLHATLGAARVYGLNPEFLVSGGMELSERCSGLQKREGMTSDEEILCYIHGELTDAVYRWLWKVNQNPRWQKEAA